MDPGGHNQASSLAVAESKASDDPKVLTKVEQSVKYSSVMDGVDVEYIVTGNSVKENIVLNHFVDDFSLSFTYSLGNLSLVLQENGTYSFVDESGKTLFDFTPLFMFDANGNDSQNIRMTVTEIGKGEYVVTITPDSEWLKTAVYPVTIDPTVRSVLQTVSFYDTYVYQGSPTTNYSTQNNMIISGTSGAYLYQGLISFVLPSSVMNKQITYSYLSMTRDSFYTTGREIALYKNAACFDASTVIWYSKPGYSAAISDYNIIGSSSVYKFDITDAVKEWQATGNQTTPGFTIKDKSSYGTNLSIRTTEYTGVASDPVVEIGYVDPEGIKDYWTYSSQDGGSSGTGYVSDYTGLMTWIREDVSFSSERQTLGLSMVYNVLNRTVDLGYGLGWQTNYNMKVVYDTYLNKYYCVDSTGNKVYYQYSSQVIDPNLDSLEEMIQYGMEAEFFISEDGSNQMMMVLYDEYDDICGIYIVTTGYTLYTFYGVNNIFHLWSITEDFPSDHPKELFIERQLYGNFEKITRVTDEVGNYLQFAYNAAGRLASVSLYLKHPSPESDTLSQRVIYQYTQPSTGVYVLSSRWLEKDFDGNATFTSDDVVTYGYDADRRLVFGSDPSLGKIEYTYHTTTNKVSVVETNRVDGATEYVFSTITYSYSTKKTTMTDQDGNYVIRKFDDYGHTVNILDSTGTAQSFSYLNLFKNHDDTTGFYTLIDGTPNYKNNHKLITESLPQISEMNPLANPDFEYGLSFAYNEWELELETGSDAQAYTIDGVTEEGEEFEEPLPRVGSGAIRIQTTNDNGAYLIQNVVLDAGTYTVSGYVRNETDSSEGVYLEAVGASYGSAPLPVSILSEWQFVYHYFVVEQDNTTILIKLSDYGSGFAYFDAIQINQGFSTSRINLIENSSFEKTNGTSPWAEWVPSDSINVTRTTMSYDSTITGEINGTYGVQIVGSPTIKRYSYNFNTSFSNYVSGDGSLLIGAWAKSEGTPTSQLTADANDRLFRINVTTYDLSGAQTIVLSDSYIDFDTSVEGWQYNFGTVAIDSQVTHIKISLEYQGEGKVYFDNCQAFFEPAFTHYAYDVYGRIISTVKPGGETVTYEYPVGNTFLRIPSKVETKTVSGEILTDSGEISSIETNNLLYSFTKNVSGQTTSVFVQEGATTYYSTSTGYLSTAFNQYVSSTTDEYGNTTHYYNDVYSGLLEAIENAKGQDTHYLYDDEGKLIEVRSEDDFDSANPLVAGKVAYAYDSQDRLIRICLQYNDPNSPTYYYQITYDEQGRMDSVKVNQSSLITFEYEVGTLYSDRIFSQTYGNLDVIRFEYDGSGRVIQVNYQLYGESSPTTRYAYAYDSMGNLNVISTWDLFNPTASPPAVFGYDASEESQ
jgi:YD repeat-containing protein